MVHQRFKFAKDADESLLDCCVLLLRNLQTLKNLLIVVFTDFLELVMDIVKTSLCLADGSEVLEVWLLFLGWVGVFFLLFKGLASRHLLASLEQFLS